MGTNSDVRKRGSSMAACEAVIRDRVITIGINSDVKEMTLWQTTMRVIEWEGLDECVKCWNRKFCMMIPGTAVRCRG